MKSVRAAAYGLAVAELAVALGPPPVRAVAGIPLVLVLPGFALTCATSRRRALDGAEQGLAVLSLSVAVVVLVALVIGALQIPLTRASYAIGLGIVCAAVLAIAAFNERRAGATPAAGPVRLPAIGPATACMLVAAVIGAAGAIGVGVVLHTSHGPGFTQLWALRVPTSNAMQIGVRSNEKKATAYRLRVSVEGAHRRGAIIVLRPGEQWTQTRALASSQRATVTLLKDGRHGTYRRVKLVAQGGT